jgi:ATP-binding cassette subfamily F protein 3
LKVIIEQAKYQLHLAEMEAVRAGMPVACVKHEAGGGHTVKDIHMDNFTISVGGHDLIVDGSVTLSFGRHYGEVLLLIYLFTFVVWIWI